MSARSHSGTFIVLVSENGTFFPVSWTSNGDGLPILDHLERILSTKVATHLCEDNSAAIMILRTGFSTKLRHMNRTHRISIAGLSELIETKEITLIPTKTEDQLADIATKPLCRAKFLHARKQLQVVSSEQIEDLRAKRVLEHTAH